MKLFSKVVGFALPRWCHACAPSHGCLGIAITRSFKTAKSAILTAMPGPVDRKGPNGVQMCALDP